jgi:Cu2+-containing amine oxidase
MNKMVVLSLGLLCLVFFTGCTAHQVTRTEPTAAKSVASDDVSASEATALRRIAEANQALKESLDEMRVVYIGSEVVRLKSESGDDDPRKTYRVIHYRYDDDTALHSLVNLSEDRVMEYQEFPHLPTSLSSEELERATGLAMESQEVLKALGQDAERVKVEALVIRTSSDDDPWFGHRVMQLMFRVGRDYRHNPRVIVDLTEEKVIVESDGGNQE